MRFIIILLCMLSLAFAKRGELSAAFLIYGDPIPEEALYAFDWLVVDPNSEHTKRVMNLFYLKNKKAKLIAYVSIGEAEPYRDYFKEVKPEWIIGDNKVWRSKVVDLRQKDYFDFLLQRVIPRMEKFDGFFLDTLDSYKLILKDEESEKVVKRNLAEFIRELRRRYPQKLILLNRGFEVMEDVKGVADAIVAENLFYGITYDERKSYKKMKQEETQWLLERLKRAKDLGYTVIVIDYVDPRDRKLQIEVARKIYEQGFIPYVSDKYLRTLGVSTYHIKPRRILMLYSKKTYKDPPYTTLNRLIQPWLEYLGFVPVLMDVEEALEDDRLAYFMADVYAGIVVDAWGYEHSNKLHRWLLGKKEEGLKIFFLESFVFPTEDKFLKAFQIKKLGFLATNHGYVVENSSFEFFESAPLLENIDMLLPQQVKYGIRARLEDKVFYPLAVTEWGGYALSGALLVKSGDYTLFTVDPVKLFEKVFGYVELIPDVTTENGRRLLLVHIDGDAFFGNADFNPSRNIGEVVRDEVIKRYPVPHTVSIIEGEIAPHGLYPEKSAKLEEIARSIFALPNVEIASHTFSHPYKWQEIYELSKYKKQEISGIQYNLPIKNYTFDLRREIFGSIEYIDTRLAPAGKKVKVFLWSGDTNPPKEAIKLTYEAGVYNVNGGYTWINRLEPFWMLISPMGVNKGEYFQIYAPILNENIYTKLWTDYGGFVRVIDTFIATEKPYRIKPINIYYHMYSGQKIASLEALKTVYNWALSQKTNPQFLSEYAQKVLEFRNMAITEDIRDGAVVVRGGGNLRTLRIEKEVHVDIKNSKGVVGYLHHDGRTYISLDASGEYKIRLSDTTAPFRLVSSNGQVIDYENRDGFYRLSLVSHVPLEVEVFAKDCQVDFYPKAGGVERKDSLIRVSYGVEKNARIEARCKK